MSGWRSTTLGHIIELQRGYDLTEVERRNGSVPVIGSAGQNGWHDTARAGGPGVTVGRSGASAGVVTFVAEPYWPHNTALFVKDFKGNDPRFIAYLLKQLPLAEMNSGAAQPSLNRNFLYPLPVRIPEAATQRRVAAILGAYDDLIEVNRRRVAVLEEMARRLFEEWFVAFRFPGHDTTPLQDTPHGPLPQGWQRVGLHDVADVAFGFPFKSARFNSEGRGSRIVRIRDVPAGETGTFSDEPFDPRYALRDGDLLVGMDGIFHTAIWVGGSAALNQRVTRLRPKDNYSTVWLMLAVLPKIKHLEATISGTTVAHLSARDLKAMTLAIGPPQLHALADRVFEPIGDAIVKHRQEQQRLAAARDLLLPRLISGELTVADAERALETAA